MEWKNDFDQPGHGIDKLEKGAPRVLLPANSFRTKIVALLVR